MQIEPKKNENELEPAEAARLEELEAVIVRHSKAFVDMGMALMEIRDSRLYRATHQTFEDYCKHAWEISREAAYKKIAAATAFNTLQNHFVYHGTQNNTHELLLPKNERQARPLSLLDPENQVLAWQQIIEYTKDHELPKITAGTVSRVVAKFLGEEIEEKIKSAAERTARDEIMSDVIKGGLAEFLRAIDSERREKWKKTTPQAALKCIRSAIEVLEEVQETILKKV